MSKLGIFVFTNDNAIILNELIQHITPLRNQINIHVIDDSFEIKQIALNKQIAKRVSVNTYLGKAQFDDFYSKIMPRRLSFWECIGNEQWNLGTARNFGLDYAKHNGYDKVLFIDQDINSFCLEEVKKGFEIVDDRTFVSFTLEGLVDDSILGHVATEYGLLADDQKMLSGGFLYFTPQTVKHRFVNIYNEDWILQLLDNKKKRVLLPYKAVHQGHLPNQICFDKLLFQEIGELIIAGLAEDSNGLLKDFCFWRNIISIRKEFIKMITNIAFEKKDDCRYDVLSSLLEKYSLVENELRKNILHYK